MSTPLRRSLAAVLVVLAAAAAGSACRVKPGGAAANATPAGYYCPMHPDYTSEHPGDCPICGMRLTAAGHTEGAEHGAAGSEPRPGGPGPAGRAAVTLGPERRQILGLRTEAVREQPLRRTIRTVGRVAVDERRLHYVHTKYEAYVEHLYVDFTGAHVEKGQPLLAIYSPELVASQQEYLLAFRARKPLYESGLRSVERGAIDMVEAARRRLLLWGILPQEILDLEKAGQPQRVIDLHSEISGYVVQKKVVQGMRVTPADTLFDVADLGHVWVLADVYESDLPLVRPGMTGEMHVSYLPGRKWTGPVTYVAPTVEAQTRTIKVRLEMDNQDEKLKPDMFADVFLSTDLGHGLAVPDSAVVQAGDRSLVFLDRGAGRLEPREVRLGRRTEDGFEVLAGLAPGDEVVTSANFLLDSESSLRAALSALGTPSGEASPPPGAHRH